MEHLLLGIMNWDGIFTVRYKEKGGNIYCWVQENGMEHLWLGIRKWDGTSTVRY